MSKVKTALPMLNNMSELIQHVKAKTLAQDPDVKMSYTKDGTKLHYDDLVDWDEGVPASEFKLQSAATYYICHFASDRTLNEIVVVQRPGDVKFVVDLETELVHKVL